MRILLIILLFPLLVNSQSVFGVNGNGPLLPPPPDTTTRAHLIFQSTYETVSSWTGLTLPVDIGTAWGNQQTCCGLASLDNAPLARVGSKAAMFTEHKNDSIVSGSLRSEITGMGHTTFNQVLWYGFSIYLPGSFNGDASALLVAQWHSQDFNTIPPLKLMIDESEHWQIVNTSTGDGTSVGDSYHDLGAINKGVWTDWVVRVLWNNTTAGQLQIFKNGVSLFSSNAIRTSYTGNNYFKTGIYAFGWAAGQGSGSPAPYIIYVDEWRIADSGGSYFDVAPGAY